MSDIIIAGNTYTDVPQIIVPKAGGGTAQFIDSSNICHYYTGSSAPTASFGEDGDIYLQTGG